MDASPLGEPPVPTGQRDLNLFATTGTSSEDGARTAGATYTQFLFTFSLLVSAFLLLCYAVTK